MADGDADQGRRRAPEEPAAAPPPVADDATVLRPGRHRLPPVPGATAAQPVDDPLDDGADRDRDADDHDDHDADTDVHLLVGNDPDHVVLDDGRDADGRDDDVLHDGRDDDGPGGAEHGPEDDDPGWDDDGHGPGGDDADAGYPDSAPPARRERTTGDLVRTGIRGVGQLLVTAGLVVLLFVVYEVWVTDLFSDQKQQQLSQDLRQDWDTGGTDDPTVPTLPDGGITEVPLGEGFAFIRIPRFGEDYVKVILEGTDEDELVEGPGHYVDSAMPGEQGNFALAGHRVNSRLKDRKSVVS